MKTQHTPGPWVAVDLPTAVAIKSHMGNVANIQRGSMRDRQQANARLIASAPDLLDALKDLAQSIVWKEFGECRGFTEEMPLPIITAVEKARAAISKATGEQQ